jgi:hypothetical protein
METIRSTEADQLSQYLIAISFIFGCRCFLYDVAHMISCYTFQRMGRYAASLSTSERTFCSKVKSLSYLIRLIRYSNMTQSTIIGMVCEGAA